MSSPEEPTRRLPPAGPEAPVPEREVVIADEGAWRREVLDRFASLRTGLVVVGVLAVAALGLAAYTLLTAEEEEDARGGPSQSQFRNLEDRVDELESQLDDRATKGGVDDLRSNQQELADRVDALEEQAGEGEDSEALQQLQQSVDDLSASVQDLDTRLQDVEEQQAQQDQQAP